LLSREVLDAEFANQMAKKGWTTLEPKKSYGNWAAGQTIRNELSGVCVRVSGKYLTHTHPIRVRRRKSPLTQ
jgi:hypothetical protein